MNRIQKLGLAGHAISCVVAGTFLCRFEKRPALPKSTVNSCVQLRTELEQNSCSGTIAYDWGELSHYRQANARITEADSKLPRVVFLGDSITLAWPALDAKEHFSGLDVINRGITGQLTSQMLLRFRQDVVDLHPQVVVILGGSNDLARVLPPALPVIESNLGSMAQLAKANGIRTVLSSLPPVSDYGHEENGVDQTRQKPIRHSKFANSMTGSKHLRTETAAFIWTTIPLWSTAKDF